MSGLLHAFYWMDESLQNQLKAAGLPQASRSQSLLMTNIADGVTRPAELARRLGISRQAIQQLLADMQERGLIELVPDPKDKRAKIVRYSMHGRDFGKSVMRALERIDVELELRIGAQSLQELRQVLVDRDWGEPLAASTEDMSGVCTDTPDIETVVKHLARN